MANEKAASENALKRRRAAWWVEILIAIAVVLVVVGIAIPAFYNSKLRKGETQAKQVLHEIRLAVERYAYDHPTKSPRWAAYPEYLIGGSAPPTGSKDASDPLIRGGYLASYPKNPFAAMVNVRRIQEEYNDPLRPGTNESKSGYRFGGDYTLMGNVLTDVRYPGGHADFGYPFYDLWPDSAKKPKQYIPGAFFYRSNPSLVSTKNISKEKEVASLVSSSSFWDWWSQPAYAKSQPWRPAGGPDSFILGVYGPPHSKGEDVLGRPVKIIIPFKDEGKVYEYNDPNVITPYNEDMNWEDLPFNSNGIPDCILWAIGGPGSA
jgi:type II secretory pathway pseudopilin PulG